ncbi:carboxymuconolactone decarboxylase family protein [Gordonia soli]|uniref:Carboxymuconolactone decarboxylase-like domain-containing protein n=1 Tax=Gordonia soli NBRC 108243 TaxID=1223545 RepID=M0QIG1_9ACTN|nr:carboxymuconolactone decarboxylase family protein [Gordonia soli]GAC68091.1 hypothetical protein GS4_11_03630 [Gordonia soli NBRC 108243]
MRAWDRSKNYVTSLRQAKRHRSDLFGWLGRRPLLMAATSGYETALLLSNKLDPKLKELAELKTAGLINCEFCLDIGSALARGAGITEQQIRDLPRYTDSSAYTALEKLVISYAEAMTRTPAVDLEEIRERLSKNLSRAQLAELAATVAWENQRARLNQGLGVRPTGMSDGAVCAIPERSVTGP